jgi:hypothetical protein
MASWARLAAERSVRPTNGREAPLRLGNADDALPRKAHGRNAVRFKAPLFNSSEGKDHFINDCCFGDDLGAWLKPRLEAQGYSVDGPDQEDWGWYLVCTKGDSCHYLNMGFSADEEWLMWIERHRSLGDRIRGRNREADPQLALDLHALLSHAPEILEIRWSHMASGSESSGSLEP